MDSGKTGSSCISRRLSRGCYLHWLPSASPRCTVPRECVSFLDAHTEKLRLDKEKSPGLVQSAVLSICSPLKPGLFLLQGKNKVRRVKTIYDCQADNDDELTFIEGEVIIVTGEEDQEWWVRTCLCLFDPFISLASTP